MTTRATAAVTAHDIVKVYGSGETAVTALNQLSVTFAAGAFTAIMGPSGSGKSTLMHCLAGLDTVQSGSIRLGDTELVGLTDKQLTLLRRKRAGFVFQTFNLIPSLTAQQNIRLPLDIAGDGRADHAWQDQVVDTLGIRDRLNHRPSELSGGQQQRVACARAFVTRPDVVFADEPTGNLDSKTSDEVLGLLRRTVDDFGQTVVMVTHDAHAASFADRLLVLRDGRVVHDGETGTADEVHDVMKDVA